MNQSVLRTIVDPTGKQRVRIVQRGNSAYGFEVESWSDDPLEQCWIPYGRYSFSICATEEIALREAEGRVPWLAAAMKPPGTQNAGDE